MVNFMTHNNKIVLPGNEAVVKHCADLQLLLKVRCWLAVLVVGVAVGIASSETCPIIWT